MIVLDENTLQTDLDARTRSKTGFQRQYVWSLIDNTGIRRWGSLEGVDLPTAIQNEFEQVGMCMFTDDALIDERTNEDGSVNYEDIGYDFLVILNQTDLAIVIYDVTYPKNVCMVFPLGTQLAGSLLPIYKYERVEVFGYEDPNVADVAAYKYDLNWIESIHMWCGFKKIWNNFPYHANTPEDNMFYVELPHGEVECMIHRSIQYTDNILTKSTVYGYDKSNSLVILTDPTELNTTLNLIQEVTE